jgi:hypothetical protein
LAALWLRHSAPCIAFIFIFLFRFLSSAISTPHTHVGSEDKDDPIRKLRMLESMVWGKRAPVCGWQLAVALVLMTLQRG